MAIVDSVVTFEGESKGFFIKPIIEEPTLVSLGWDFVYGQTDMWLYFNTTLGKITREKTACGSTDSTDGIDVTRKQIQYVELEAYKTQCYKTFDNTILAMARKTGINKADLINGTGDIQKLLLQVVEEAVMRDFLRIALLGNTALASADYNMIDGWYVKVNADPDTVQSGITLNATTLNTTNFNGTIQSIYVQRSRRAKQTPASEMAWYVTRNVYDAWQAYLLSNANTDSSLNAFISGDVAPKLLGIDLIVLDIVDEFLEADFTSSGVTDQPYRIVLAKKDQTKVAIDSPSAGKELEIWYDNNTELNKYRAKYNLDIQIGYGEFFTIAGF